MTIGKQDSAAHDDLDMLGQSIGMAADDESAALPKRAAPGMLRFMPPLIRETWDRGATFQLDNNTGDILIDGFYKNGPLRVSVTDEGLVAHEFPDKKTPVAAFSDLVDINFRYWTKLNRPKGVYIHPERPWLDAFRERNLVTRTVIYIPADSQSS